MLVLVSWFNPGLWEDELRAMRSPHNLKPFIEALGILVVVCLAILIIWPMPTLQGIYQRTRDRVFQFCRIGEYRANFSPRRRDLIHTFTLDEVEQLERVDDPLGAAPNLPFGHVHLAWRSFVASAGPAAQFWSYGCDWKNPGGWGERREGYAAFNGKRVTAFFETVFYRTE